MWRRIRISILLAILAFVAVDQWLGQRRVTDWGRMLHVVVYPIDGDGRPSTRAYLAGLEAGDFAAIGAFLEREAGRHGIEDLAPVVVDLGPVVDASPPRIPSSGSAWRAILWSLEVRFWAWRVDRYAGPSPDVRLFVSYYDPEATSRLAHSAGLRKGRIGVIKAFASPRFSGRNRVVITHELMHTLGASDHYDPANNLPRYPEGYADPGQEPLHPQRRAEIMGGRIPVSEDRAVMPEDLSQVVVGELTAREIHWID